MESVNKPIISVIVPVYKVEEYLEECVESILTQTFKDFELILVDDGSPDRCGEMCDKYAITDKRVRVIHKKNGGLSDARNAGIDEAKGDYISFIDSDDYISSDYLEYLLAAAKKYNADFVQGNRATYKSKLGAVGTDRHKKSYTHKKFNREEAIIDFLLYKTMYANAWAALYDKKLFQDIRYPVGKLTEDEYTTYKLILKSETVVCIPQIIYYYRLRDGSIVHSFSDKRFDVCDEVPKLLKDALKDAGIYQESILDYKSMRIWIKIYNDFIQGGAYTDYKVRLDAIQRSIKEMRVDYSVWDRRYIVIKWVLSYAPHLYRYIVYKYRKNLYGTDSKKS